MDNWMLPVLLIPTCAVIVNAITPRLQGALSDLHHLTHDECSICQGRQAGFRNRVRLLCAGSLMLFIASTIFAFGGLLGAVDSLSHLFPSWIQLVLLLVGAFFLLAGCFALALESLLLMSGTWK